MKYRFHALPIMAMVALTLSGCGGRSHVYHIQIEQTSTIDKPMAANPENVVSGNCLVSTATGSHTEDFLNSGNFEVQSEGTAISCTASARNDFNTLKMTIVRDDGAVVGESQTGQPHEMVSVAGG